MTYLILGEAVYRIEDIVGLEVVTADGRLVGMVEGTVLDTSNWTVPVLRVGLKKGVEETIGLKKPLFGSASVYIKTEGVDSLLDVLTLTKELKEFKEIVMESETDLTTAGNVVGTRVICKGARQIGYVDNFIFEPNRSWSIPYIQVRLDKSVVEDLNQKRSILSTPIIRIQTSDIKTLGDMVMLKIDIEELRDYLEKKPMKNELGETPVGYEGRTL